MRIVLVLVGTEPNEHLSISVFFPFLACSGLMSDIEEHKGSRAKTTVRTGDITKNGVILKPTVDAALRNTE